MSFPQRRLRRLRRTEALRRMVRESRLHPDDLIAPLFVKEGAESPIPITSLPGQMQHTRESLRKEVNELVHMGVPS
ncbi:MAG: porphobilinogen synthase, partial [Actinomycetota bacterium]